MDAVPHWEDIGADLKAAINMTMLVKINEQSACNSMATRAGNNVEFIVYKCLIVEKHAISGNVGLSVSGCAK